MEVVVGSCYGVADVVEGVFYELRFWGGEGGYGLEVCADAFGDAWAYVEVAESVDHGECDGHDFEFEVG